MSERVEVLAEVAEALERLRVQSPMNGDGSNHMLDKALGAIDRLSGHAPLVTIAVRVVRNERAEASALPSSRRATPTLAHPHHHSRPRAGGTIARKRHMSETEADGTAALCENGITPSGWHCTGGAHVGGIVIRCTDPSHIVALAAPIATTARPTFSEVLNDPMQQLDTEGVVLAAVLDARDRDHLRSEGWRACAKHLQQQYDRRADSHPAEVPYLMLDGEELWFLANHHNPWRAPAIPPASEPTP